MSPAAATPAPTQADRNGRGPVASLSWLTTIRARLYTALGFMAAMTVVCSLIALYAFTNIGGTTTEIVSQSMPATVHSLRLAEETSDLVASAPRLMTAEDESRRSEIADQIAQQARNLVARIERLRMLDASRSAEIDAAQIAMVERIAALNQAVTERITISDQRQAMTFSIRKAHEELLEGITPAIDDANFELMTKTRGAGTKEANEEIESLRRLLEVQAEANLLAGLLTESSMVTESMRLQPLRELIDAARGKIEIEPQSACRSRTAEKPAGSLRPARRPGGPGRRSSLCVRANCGGSRRHSLHSRQRKPRPGNSSRRSTVLSSNKASAPRRYPTVPPSKSVRVKSFSSRSRSRPSSPQA